MAPVLGQQVFYIVTDEEITTMNNQSNCNSQQILPATIVAVWGDTPESAVNIKIHLDGEGDLWKTSITQGTSPGDWKMPPSE